MRLHPSVTKIEAHAFHSCRLLATAASCEGLEIIGESAFFLCTHLKQLVLPRTKNLTYPKRCICIELMDLKLPEYRGVFAGCKSLTNVRISPGVRIMEDHVFNGCSSLFSVELSEGIERIGIYAFSQCMQLKHAFIPSTVIQFGDHVFRWCNKLEELFPAHTKEQLLDALRNRFNGLPIDKLCYFQSSKDSETWLQEVELIPQEPPEERNRDIFDMTPLHIFAFSTTPNLGLCQALTKRSTTDLTSRDRWGSLPTADDFAVNFPPGMIPSIKFVMALSYANRLAGLGLKEWRMEAVNEIENLKEGADLDEREQQVFRLRSTVSQYWKKEQV
jgi:hypothetical protein